MTDQHAMSPRLAAELDKAHRIIRIALNCLQGEAKVTFVDHVIDARLDGEGITRANEREALLLEHQASQS